MIVPCKVRPKAFIERFKILSDEDLRQNQISSGVYGYIYLFLCDEGNRNGYSRLNLLKIEYSRLIHGIKERKYCFQMFPLQEKERFFA